MEVTYVKPTRPQENNLWCQGFSGVNKLTDLNVFVVVYFLSYPTAPVCSVGSMETFLFYYNGIQWLQVVSIPSKWTISKPEWLMTWVDFCKTYKYINKLLIQMYLSAKPHYFHRSKLCCASVGFSPMVCQWQTTDKGYFKPGQMSDELSRMSVLPGDNKQTTKYPINGTNQSRANEVNNVTS
jgi:hypothetical protein